MHLLPFKVTKLLEIWQNSRIPPLNLDTRLRSKQKDSVNVLLVLRCDNFTDQKRFFVHRYFIPSLERNGIKRSLLCH
ncbi:hypothetical protein JTE90_027438 [Oedothorax gibbosus]|uniref:Uncharacterized protein n=1 Tax=Oedothorax gibbosus TaxID=931172 RepID=A0AAV6W327_9ARAC|nr:hypothetical protein JTE90_027438 [Oedothorax gibbosus]